VSARGRHVPPAPKRYAGLSGFDRLVPHQSASIIESESATTPGYGWMSLTEFELMFVTQMCVPSKAMADGLSKP
jgi:hypothetical protein